MKIVIDIPDDTYKYVKQNYLYGIGAKAAHDLGFAVIEGKPLPKGYGRLIDAKEIESTLNSKAFDLAGTTRRYTEVRWALKQVQNAPTILEADKE